MATEYKRLDNNGLLYLLTLLKTEIDNAGEDNVIETVKVNGTALTPVNKAVDVEVPIKTSDLTNDGDGTSNFATEDYVDENGGKIDVIKVNGTAQTITNKEVDIDMPVFTVIQRDGIPNNLVSVIASKDGEFFQRTEILQDENGNPTKIRTRLVKDNNTGKTADTYVTTKVDELLADKTDETQVQDMIDDALADITGVDFVLVDTLPATGEKGKIYLVPNGGTSSNVKDEYIWLEPTGATPYFEKIGSTDIDLSGYVQASEMHALTNAEIDTIFQQVFGN